MGFATLNVWIHDRTDPCRMSMETWSVTVYYCDGTTPVQFCPNLGGPPPFPVSAPCGHVEFLLPPGCYVVQGALESSGTALPPSVMSDHGIVVVGCDEKACVHLFTPPSVHLSGPI